MFSLLRSPPPFRNTYKKRNYYYLLLLLQLLLCIFLFEIRTKMWEKHEIVSNLFYVFLYFSNFFVFFYKDEILRFSFFWVLFLWKGKFLSLESMQQKNCSQIHIYFINPKYSFQIKNFGYFETRSRFEKKVQIWKKDPDLKKDRF